MAKSKWVELNLSVTVEIENEEDADALAEEIFTAACAGTGEGEAHRCERQWAGTFRVVEYDDANDSELELRPSQEVLMHEATPSQSEAHTESGGEQ